MNVLSKKSLHNSPSNLNESHNLRIMWQNFSRENVLEVTSWYALLIKENWRYCAVIHFYILPLLCHFTLINFKQTESKWLEYDRHATAGS